MSLTGAFIPDDRRLKSPEAIFDELRRTPRNIRAAYASVMVSGQFYSPRTTAALIFTARLRLIFTTLPYLTFFARP